MWGKEYVCVGYAINKHSITARFASPKCEMDTHAEVAGGENFKATKSQVTKEGMKYISGSFYVR